MYLHITFKMFKGGCHSGIEESPEVKYFTSVSEIQFFNYYVVISTNFESHRKKIFVLNH